jgi:phosphoribulokinase
VLCIYLNRTVREVGDLSYISTIFYVLLTVHLSIFISVFNQLDAQNFCFTISLFHASTCFEHHVLIIKRSKLHYTASGIITPIGGRLVHRLRED